MCMASLIMDIINHLCSPLLQGLVPHYLFLIHTDAFGPVSTNLGGHVYVMNCPLIRGLSGPMTTTIGRCNNCVGGSQATVNVCMHVYYYN